MLFLRWTIRFGYYQSRISTLDISKTTFWTCYDHYEFLVMSFELGNDPTTFWGGLFCLYLNSFIIVFIDDI